MMKFFILKLIGSISLMLGVLGAFLPLLPSTCFILLSTWAFSKSSPRFHRWLYYQSPFSNSIQNWQQYRVIPNRVKAAATASIVISYGITAMIVSNVFVLVALGVAMVALLAFLLTRPSEAKAQEDTQLRITSASKLNSGLRTLDFLHIKPISR